ncbi:MAG: helix-hairpin-helix domain-containing protein [Candidatus Omnitrophica bacterium]|nr:helix-hairpin-helix domain-containing protein [Candidatus Omnitrophota bacterium]
MPRLYFCPQRKNGSIIMICLWIMVILGILGMGLTGLVFQEIRFSSAISRLNLSLPMAKAALRVVFYERAADTTPDYDTLQELATEKSVSICGSNPYKYYFVDKQTVQDSEEIIDESALININLASLDVLKRLPGVDEDMADKIANAGFRPYSSINEVLLVEGVTVEKFRLFKDMVTVYGKGKVNINTASKAVLVCLGLDEELADIILRYRKVHRIEPKKDKDGNPIGPQDECGFSSLSSLVTDLREFSSLGLRQEQDLLSLQNSLAVKSGYLRFNIVPQINNKTGTHYSVVINPETKKIVSWREY